jgi:hypothetical protein
VSLGGTAVARVEDVSLAELTGMIEVYALDPFDAL